MTDITPMRMVIRAVIGDRGVHPYAAGNKRQKAAAGLKRPCCGFFCSLLKSKRKRYIWKERPRIEGEGVKNAE
jgi:hypothetical protein